MPDAPLDPVYVKFRNGYLNANDDVTDALRLRWSPRAGGWFRYAVERFILDDVALPDTSPGDLIKNFPTENLSADRDLPPVFAAVQAVYATYGQRWPGLVWALRGGGDWRNAIERNPAPPGPPDTDPPGHGPLPPECIRRINEVREYAARGDITTAQAQKMIAKIVAECTGVPAEVAPA